MGAVARIIPREVVEQEGSLCRKCGKPILGDSSSFASRSHDICSECLAEYIGDTASNSWALLISKGVILIARYRGEGVYKLRVECRSTHRSELDRMQRELGAGRIYAHGRDTWRWSVASLKDLNHLGNEIMEFLPTFAVLLQMYTVQPNKKQRSAFAEAVAIRMGARTIRFIDYV